MTRIKCIALLAAAFIASHSFGQGNITWVGGDATNPTFWDDATENWSGDFTTFLDGDNVTFDDTASTFDVEIQQVVSPASVTFNNTANTYTVTGNTIQGDVNFNLSANSSVVLSLNGDTTYTGVTTIGSGATLQIGTGTSNANLFGLGSVVNNGTFILARQPNTTEGVALGLSGTGNVVVQSGNLAFLQDTTYSGTTTIADGAALDLRGATGNTGTIGSAAAGTTVGLGGSVITTGVTGTVAEAFTLNGGALDARLSPGDPPGASNVTFSGPITVGTGGNASLILAGGTDALNPPNTPGMTVTTNITGSNGNGLVANVGGGSTMLISGNVAHNGSLTKSGAGLLTLTGTNSYSGNTTINGGGTLDISGAASNTITAASGQALSGDGTLVGNATIQSGATLRVGDAGNLSGTRERLSTDPITYVDAVFTGAGANTTLADGTPMNLVADQASLTNPEDYFNKGDTLDPVGQIPHWLERPRAAANGTNSTVYVASPQFGDDAMNVDVPVIKTTITGLTPGETYDVQGFYWDRSGPAWDISFGLTEAGLTAFPDPGVRAVDSTFTGTVSFVDAGGAINLAQANLGEAVADASGTIAIFIDDGPSTDRTWYDGVGFAQVTFAPGFADNFLTLTVDGDVTLDAGSTTEIELFATNVHDRLDVTGELAAGGTLEVSLAPGAAPFSLGDMVDILDFGSVTGSFALNFEAPGAGLAWDASNLLTTGVIEVVTGPALTGDYNGDGVVNMADYTTWRDSLNADGSTLLNRDPNNSGLVSDADYSSWLVNFGNSAPGSLQSAAQAPVPEPTAIHLVLGVVAVAGGLVRCRRS